MTVLLVGIDLLINDVDFKHNCSRCDEWTDAVISLISITHHSGHFAKVHQVCEVVNS